MALRIIIAGIVLILVNAVPLFSGLESNGWIAPVSIIVGVYLLLQGLAFRRTAPAAPSPGPVAAEPVPEPVAPVEREIGPEVKAYLAQFLGLLQEKGRFLDFVMDDIAGYSNEQVGAAARVVHQGCAKVVSEHFLVEPVRVEEEGGPVVLESGYDASEIRAVGNLSGSAPFHGVLLHKGWRARKIDLPRLIEKPVKKEGFVIAPAEVEIGKG